MIDLHTHSYASDGTLSPTEIISRAHLLNIKAVALTDHDTIDGIDEFIKAGNKNNVETIPGIEFSTTFKNMELHILGLLIDYKSCTLREALKEIQHDREHRNHKMVARFNEIGIEIRMKDVLDASGGNIITRAHFAKALKNKGYISEMKEAFDKYIGINGPCYIKRKSLTSEYAIKLIKEAGGIPILAHPLLYNLNLKEIGKLLDELKALGLEGVECIYSIFSPQERILLKSMAIEKNLLVSGGSDFHGSNKQNLELGIGKGNLHIPYTILEQLKEARKS